MDRTDDTRPFLSVEIPAGDLVPDGLSLRFRALAPPSPLTRLAYEADDGTDGWWRTEAHAALVEDSSEGTALLVFGDEQGVELTHEATGQRVREPYLLLAATTHRVPAG